MSVLGRHTTQEVLVCFPRLHTRRDVYVWEQSCVWGGGWIWAECCKKALKQQRKRECVCAGQLHEEGLGVRAGNFQH